VGQGASYPAAGAHQRDPVGTEPPLGYSVDAMFEEPSTGFLSSPGEQLPNPACGDAAPSAPLDVEQRGAGLGLSPSLGPSAPPVQDTGTLTSVRADEVRVSSFRRRRL
jgi:hypothetical protein